MKTILITGGSDGLGKTIAAILAKDHKVIILSPNEEKLRQTATELGCDYKVCDVRDYTQTERVVQELGPIDCVINNAGLWIEGLLEQNDPHRIDEVLQVNALGTIHVTKAAVPVMKQQKAGLIINVISTAGRQAKAERAVYAASKWAITGFTQAMQDELASHGIRVTGVYPGKIGTHLFAKAGVQKDLSDALHVEDVAQAVAFIVNFNGAVSFTDIGMIATKH